MLEWILFLALSILALVTAAGMILTMSMYRAGLALMASFAALAGLFILLDADLLAAIQIMMNVGGMLVMVLFMVMIMMDPGGEMMWAMKRDMHMPGPGAFSMHMPWGKPPEEKQKEQETTQAPEWTCPMHPEVQQNQPGTCPKCGMALIPRAEMAGEHTSPEMSMQTQTYTCPMHPEVRQNQPGNCPKCGMALIPVEEQHTGKQTDEPETYICSMHPDVRQDQPGTCPKCGMALIPAHESSTGQSLSMELSTESGHSMHSEQTDGEGDHTMHMPGHEMNMQNTSGSDHEMSVAKHEMNMAGMTPRQYYQMMVDMAMSTAQLPWAIALGIASALLLILLVVQTPWQLSSVGPTQDATNAVGELLLSRYMIGFEGAAFLILAGIAGAVILAKRERVPLPGLQTKHPEIEQAEQQIYTCPMHPEVRQNQPGTCPKCGMNLIPVEETPAASSPSIHGGHT